MAFRLRDAMPLVMIMLICSAAAVLVISPGYFMHRVSGLHPNQDDIGQVSPLEVHPPPQRITAYTGVCMHDGLAAIAAYCNIRSKSFTFTFTFTFIITYVCAYALR